MTWTSALADQTPPLLPETSAALDKLIARRHTRNSSLQQAVLKDPAAALAVLRRVAQLSPDATGDVIDIAHAISLIGVSAFQRLLSDLPTLATAEPARTAALRAHYAEAAHAASYARAWGELRGWANLDGLATTALLQNPSALVLATYDHEAAMRARNASYDGVAWCSAYTAELGADPRSVNLALAEKWLLPRNITTAMRAEPTATPAARLASLASDLGRVTVLGWPEEETAELLAKLADILRIAAGQARILVLQQAATTARELQSIAYPTAAFAALLLPGEAPLTPADLGRLDRVLSRQTERRQATAVRKANRRTTQHTLVSVMRKILEATGVERVVFFMLVRNQRSLRARLALGVQANDPLRELTVSLAGRQLFERLLTSPQSVWCNPGNASSYLPLLPPELRAADLRPEFFAMSLVVDDKPFGLLFGDGKTLSEQGYQRFRRLCRQAAGALGSNQKAA